MMATDPFYFLRATFYRWVQLWPVICPGLSAAPHVLAIGDLHVENFGTWRDAEGRWVWGVNDFDEAFPMAYTIDLVRLATSALFARVSSNMKSSDEELLNSLLQGYRDSLEKGGSPVCLETHLKMRQIALQSTRDPQRYWKKLQSLPVALNLIATDEVKEMMLRALPEGAKPLSLMHRRAGLGSLGRPRYMLLADFQGGLIGRECKPSIPSACYFAADQPPPYETRQQDIVKMAVRAPDPFFKMEKGWVIRRLAPESSKVLLVNLPAADEQEIFYFMGWETANIHLGSKHALDNVLDDLKAKPSNWLLSAAQVMKHAIEQDFEVWKTDFKASSKSAGARSAL
eukprot:TRINITY_DN3965_c0_g1_i1.p1 TRINITY_DN3965_c0_g1~~TRINITY_DN3965_c0_g1_i1.p1  ORF type:complete len:352 (-),score=87.34 TRINITY_DN3965_c0_g1_i1:174-1199(-)